MKLAKIEIIVGILGLIGTGWLTPWLDMTRFGLALSVQAAVFFFLVFAGIASSLDTD